MAPPDFVAVGHIVKDITASGWRLGGGGAYTALQASRLGLRVAAVTSCATDVDPAAEVPAVDWHIIPSPTTTTFENRYARRRREQRVSSRADRLEIGHVPSEWRQAPIILLAPVFHDIDPAIVTQVGGANSLVGLAAQGWLRRAEGDRVQPGKVEPRPAWLGGDAVFVSEEDVLDADAVAAWQETVAIVALTRGERGCTVWDHDGRHDVASFPAEPVDTTGAGDAFAAAFLIALHEGQSTLDAARFASAAGALAVRAPGLAPIGARAEIEALIRSAAPVSR